MFGGENNNLEQTNGLYILDIDALTWTKREYKEVY
jgi:hypothetical protein